VSNKLTAKQEAFCREYLIDLNATQAAIRAGYSIGETPPKQGYYTYALVSDLHDECFYIGKGKGGRVFDHVRGRLKPGNKEKNSKINECIDCGLDVRHIILSNHSSEIDAYRSESDLVELIGYDKLTNISKSERKKTEKRLLPSIYEFNTAKDWAESSLSILRPLIASGHRIEFLGDSNDYIHESVIGIIESCLDFDLRFS
jgi:hypothetical protein